MSADQSIAAAHPGTRVPILRWIRRAACNALRRADAFLERRRLRNILDELSDDQLRDIGLTRGESFQEPNIALWKPRSSPLGELHIRPEEPDGSIAIEASGSGKPLSTNGTSGRKK